MKMKRRYDFFKRSLAMSLVFTLFVSLFPQNSLYAASSVTLEEMNLLKNSSFEDADLIPNDGSVKEAFNNWYAYRGPVKVEGAGNAHDGNYAVKSATAGGSLEQDVKGLQPGLTYEYTVWVKADDASKGSMQIGVKNHGSGQLTVKATKNDWTQYSIEFTPIGTDRARLFAWLESNQAGNNFYIDNAKLTVKSDLKQVSAQNGTITSVFNATAPAPSAKDFEVSYSSSINPDVTSPLLITGSSVSDDKTTFTMNFDPIEAGPVDQTITMYVTYQTNTTLTLDFPIAASGEEVITAKVKSLSASNGTLTALLDRKPSVAPVTSDFTFKYKINEGEFKTLNTKDFAYDSDNLQATFNFNRLPSNSSEQTITIEAIYQGEKTPASFTIGVAEGVSYYVANSGSDNNDGRSPDKAFLTIDKLNTIDFMPGDHIYFKKGDRFKGAFKPKGSGVDGYPIIVASYGEEDGERPILEPSDKNWSATLMSAEFSTTVTVNNVISFYNQSYWEVRDLELSGPNHKPDSQVYHRGINITGEDAGDLNHFYFDNLVIHGFHGPDTNQGKSSGGILMEVQAKPNTPASEHIPTSINDIRITNSELYDLGRSGVNFVSVWARRAETTDTKWGPYPSNHAPGRAGYAWKPYEDFYLANNLIYDIDGDGAIIDNNKDAVIENNLVYRAASSGSYAVGLFNWNSDNTTFQFNEVYDTKRAGDGQGIEIDALNDGTLVQYNYVHDNAGGTFMWCNTPGLYGFNGIFRYNISQNDDTEHGVIDWRTGTFGAMAYNNTVYMKADGYKKFMYGSGGNSDAKFYNNIFYYPGDTPHEEANFSEHNIDWQNNLFYNFKNTPSNDRAVITADPLFVDPGTGGTGEGRPVDTSSLTGYQLQSGSPAVNAGKPIKDNGGRDYFGNSVTGIPDIGAFESGTVSFNVDSPVYTVNQDLKTISILDSESLTVDTIISNLVYDEGVNLKVYRGTEEITGTEEIHTNDILKLKKEETEKSYTLLIVHDPELLSISSKVYTVNIAGKTIGVPQDQTITVDKLLDNLIYSPGVKVSVFHGTQEIRGTDTVVVGDMIKLAKGNYTAVYIITGPHHAGSSDRDISVTQYTATAGSVEANGGANEGPARLVLDNNPNTVWHSLWKGDVRENLYITLTLSDKPYMVDGLRYMPRTGGGANGIIQKYKIQYSTNGTEFVDVPGGTGNWSMTGWQDVQFAPVAAKAIRLYGVETLSAESGKLFASAAEIRLTGYERADSDTTPPAAPTGVTIDENGVTQNSVIVRWTAPADDDVLGYKVYVNDGNSDKITYVNGTGTTFLMVQDLMAGTSYTVTVTAIDKSGNESAKSDSVSIDITDQTLPTAPMNLKASDVKDTTAMITWDASTSNVDITGYEVYLNNSLLDTINSKSYNLSGLTANTSYTIKVRAVNSNGIKSGFSSIVVTTKDTITLEPDTPTTTLSSVKSVQSGKEFAVQLGLNSVIQSVYAVDIRMEYDPSLFEFIDAKPVKDGVSLVEIVKDTPGKLRFIMASIGADNAITSDVQLLDLTFKATTVEKPITATISVTDTTMGNDIGEETTAAPSSINIEITSETSPPGIPGDVNNDDKVSIGDLAIIAANYGKTSESMDWEQIKHLDFNGDGKIDIVDLGFVASKMVE
ncbi:fibronectin type III domain-containing protein [Paenibacillus sp. Marseille-Q4541]|uniref:fibronectin type III domain-containing protein n=1 Tax=Paenibacillus sp. Marseille-Q4541 TaxID=2831522 RepID=UPI001BADF8CD|nr:fibronectin type III domain-containing protein [Paenibacillus sp. Marseille-Q4541]